MCLAVPARIIELREANKALADIGGVQREISLNIVNDILVGDYVIVHVGFALAKLDKEEAELRLQMFEEMCSLVGA